MCNWCNPQIENEKAIYDLKHEDTKFIIGIEGNEIVVYRFPPNFNGHANMALELDINYCPMCGRRILEDEDEE